MPQSEAGFLAQVIALARLRRWLTAHFRPARVALGGWRTPIQGDGKGFPDLVLVRERTIFAELKSDTGRTTPDQHAWLLRLKEAGEEVYLWSPRMWDEIERVLQ